MSDPRLTPFNGRVAHVSLKGQVEAEQFVEGEQQRVIARSADLAYTPGGPRERELWFGEEFTFLDRQGVFAFGICQRDGAVGWVHGSAFDGPVTPTHRVSVARSIAMMAPDVKEVGDTMAFTFGSPVAVVGRDGDWSRINTEKGLPACLPSCHLVPLDMQHTDPVATARLFLGTPYLWGGNSAYGIDCSGLVQAVLLNCGQPCPPDSDLQELMPGASISEGETLQTGDLIFWRGHVAMAIGPDRIIHANAHHMAVVEEPVDSAIHRIASTDTGEVTSRLRPKALSSV